HAPLVRGRARARHATERRRGARQAAREEEVARSMDAARPPAFFVLTGAGVSADSGVPTFRDAGGLWEGQRVEDVATPEAWRRNPALVWRFYQLRRARLRAVEPNAAHRALARLECEVVKRGGRVTLVSQNVDDLHQRAGSTVIAMHGSIAH